MDAPLVSVLMPLRNAATFVGEALESVLAEIGEADEVIVVDDGSTDGSDEVVAAVGDPRIRVVQGPGHGIAAAFNRGLEACRGSITMRCDADDRFVPGRIQAQLEILRRRPGIGAVCGAFDAIDVGGRLISEPCRDVGEGEITDELLEGLTPTHFCTFAVRTELLRRVGGCREAFVTAEDIDLQLRLAEITRVWFAARSLYEYRLHGGSITHRQADDQRVFFEQLARDCRQERAAGRTDSVDRGEAPRPPAGTERANSLADQVQGQHISQAWRYHAEGRRLDALKSGLRAIAARPGRVAVWRSTLALILKPRPSQGNAT